MLAGCMRGIARCVIGRSLQLMVMPAVQHRIVIMHGLCSAVISDPMPMRRTAILYRSGEALHRQYKRQQPQQTCFEEAIHQNSLARAIARRACLPWRSRRSAAESLRDTSGRIAHGAPPYARLDIVKNCSPLPLPAAHRCRCSLVAKPCFHPGYFSCKRLMYSSSERMRART